MKKKEFSENSEKKEAPLERQNAVKECINPNEIHINKGQ